MTRRRITLATAVTALAALMTGCSSLSRNMNLPGLGRRYSPQTRFNVARTQEQQGKLPDAMKLYKELYDDGQTDAKVCQRLAIVHTRLGQHQEAEGYFKQALQQKPRNTDLLCDYGYALTLRRDFKGAERTLRAALRTRPTHKRATNNLAAVLGKQGRFEECLRTYRRVVTNAEAHANLAYIHAQRGEGALAVKNYSQALSLNPGMKNAAHAMVQLSRIEQRFLKTKRGRELLASAKNGAKTKPLQMTPAPPKTSDVEIVEESAPRVLAKAQETRTPPAAAPTPPTPVIQVSHEVVAKPRQQRQAAPTKPAADLHADETPVPVIKDKPRTAAQDNASTATRNRKSSITIVPKQVPKQSSKPPVWTLDPPTKTRTIAPQTRSFPAVSPPAKVTIPARVTLQPARASEQSARLRVTRGEAKARVRLSGTTGSE